MRVILAVVTLAFLCGCASIQERYANTSTAQLKFRHAQLVDFLQIKGGAVNVRVGPPLAMAMGGDGGVQDAIEEKQDIEVELFRRWNAGDNNACLPMFSR